MSEQSPSPSPVIRPVLEGDPIYFYNEKADQVGYRSGVIVPLPTRNGEYTLDDVFKARGVEPRDFAIFATVLESVGLYVDDYLVLQHGGFASEIAPSRLIAEDPRKRMTYHLTKTLASISLDDLVQFSGANIDMERILRIGQEKFRIK